MKTTAKMAMTPKLESMGKFVASRAENLQAVTRPEIVITVPLHIMMLVALHPRRETFGIHEFLGIDGFHENGTVPSRIP